MLGTFSVSELDLLSSKLTTSFFDSWLFKISSDLTLELITGFTVRVEGTSFGLGERRVVVLVVLEMVVEKVVVEIVVVVGVVFLSTNSVWKTDLSTQAKVSLRVRDLLCPLAEQAEPG